MTGGGALPAAAGAAPRGARLATLLLLGLGAWLLWVPRERVVLMHDMLGYAAQGRALLEGAGNAVVLDGQPIPGIYPAGLPALVALAQALLGPDLRHAQVAVWLAALLLLALGARLGARLLGPWGAALALALLLASGGLRDSAMLVLSQVPSAALMLAAAALFLVPRAGAALFAAGLLASLTLLLRLANAGFPAALGLAALLPWSGRGASRGRTLAVLAAGLASGAVLVAWHNAWAWGAPLASGYGVWSEELPGSFALGNILAPALIGNRGDESIMLRSFLGLGSMYPPPVLALAVWGVLALWRSGGTRRAFAGLAVLAVAAQDLLLACYAFRSEAYLVPALPLQLLAAAAGLDDLARRLPRGGAGWALAGAGAWLLASLLVPGPADRAAEEARQRYAHLERTGLLIEDRAALVTPCDFPLVEALVRRPGRRVLYAGPFVSEVVEQAAMRELGGGRWRPERAVPWVAECVGEGRPVYFDQFPPVRGLLPAHRKLRDALRAAFTLEPTAQPGLYRLGRRD